MSFNYLNYARYLLAKLGALDTVSKPVCDSKLKVSKLASDMITYYNSISKVIYGSDRVTDVTPTGDLNGFRAMASASVAGILKGLAYYEPVFRLGPGSFSVPAIRSDNYRITGLNARLDGVIEDQNRLQIDTGIVEGTKGPYMVSIAWVPYAGEVFSIIAVPMPDTSLRPRTFAEDSERYAHGILQRIGTGIRDTVLGIKDYDNEGSNDKLTLDITCWNGNARQTSLDLLPFGDNAYSYLGPCVLDSGFIRDISVAQKPRIMTIDRNGVERMSMLRSDQTQSTETVSFVTNFPKLELAASPSMAQAWKSDCVEFLRFTPHTQYVMADTRAINLMFLLINDILAEITYA